MASSVISGGGVGGVGREEAVFNGGMVQILTTSFFRGRVIFYLVETCVGGG